MASWANGDSKNVQRKKWNVPDRSSSSLDNLKNQLAQDGCSDLQYDLAKQLLQYEVSEEVSVEYHHQGIDWLLRAANQGHEQAMELLADCYTTRRGINDSNECEVRLCLGMSPAERAARKAARELFLCLSNGGEFITASQLENKMREIYQMDDRNKNRSRRTDFINQRNNSEILTEANLITAAVNYSNGMLPNLNDTLCLTTPHPDSLNHIPSFYRPLFHPVLFATLLYYRLVGRLAALPDLLWQYKVPLLLLIYLIFSKEKDDILFRFLPTGVYLICIGVMVVATFKILKAKHEFIDFRLWSGLFQHFGRELALYRENTEAQFLRNNLKPYLAFFAALLVNIMLQPMVTHELLPHSEITIIALSLALITALVFICTTNNKQRPFFPNVFIVLSLLINVLAKYPYDMENVMDSSWEMFDALLPGGYGHKIGTGIELRLNFKALFYLLIPVVLLQIGSCEKWRGIYKYLVPHCVTLSWLQLGMACAHDSTMFGLVRASAELMGTILFLPLLGLVALLLPVLTAVEAFLIDQKVKIVAFVVLATVVILLYGYLSSSRRWSKWFLAIQVALYSVAILAIIPLVEKNLKLLEDGDVFDGMGQMSHHLKGEPYNGLSWETYSKYCQSTKTNKIETQLRCTLLDGELVRWEGSVKSVEILQVQNPKKQLLSYVYPQLLRNILTCLMGEENAVNCPPNENCGNVQDYVEGRWKCNLNKWNIYTYLIRMRMDSGLLKSSSSVLLTASHEFRNFTIHLHTADRIWFQGELKSKVMQSDVDLAPEEPLISLNSVGCLSCHNADLKFESRAPNYQVRGIVSGVRKSFKYLLNAIFNPVLIFK